MEFIVKEITKFDLEDSLLTAKVVFNLCDNAGSLEVAQTVTVELRLEVSGDLTIDQLEEVLLRKATEQLRTVLSKCGDMTARELRIQSEDLSPLLQR